MSALLAFSGVVTVSVLLYNSILRPSILLKMDLPLKKHTQPVMETPIKIPRVLSNHDQDADGIDDLDDIVHGARAEVERRPFYKSAYYRGGYPPATEGTCTDVIWRAFRDAGYDLKILVDSDIAANIKAYPRVERKPDPNIDFRRVPNLTSFFNRHAMSLTIEVRPGDVKNLELWQGGDIVVFGKPCPHIGIISDRRRPDGVPLLIHNGGPYTTEADYLLDWPSPITNHFRFPK
ncbi:MAG: DUF1287 domain-containing protein [Actinobacteria bacterium]|nr:DUF1287 domain-containing protein [Actinomycetota bacterium]